MRSWTHILIILSGWAFFGSAKHFVQHSRNKTASIVKSMQDQGASRLRSLTQEDEWYDVFFVAKSTYIKVKVEGDRTMPLYSDAASGGNTSAEFSSKPRIFVIIHSDAVATLKLRDKKDGAQFYGQVSYRLQCNSDVLYDSQTWRLAM